MRVVIMGGTSGIGLATADLLTADGAEVIVTGRDPDRVAAVKTATAASVDATSDEDLTAFFASTGPFDHLVLAFSQGHTGVGPLAAIGPDHIRAAFEGKVFPYLSCIQKAQVTSSITMISASSARSTLPGITALAAANGAIERMVSPLAAELAPVRVNAVSPGVIDTPWWSFLPEPQKEAQFATAAESLPLKRVGRPTEVAEAIRYLLTATYVTGAILPVDGGFTVA
ncbi:SDR family oxidoreductase [Actinomadura sp. SCN-SB]|uniref:SDR family oxidoreductase n=1 Tax=Actinomadura sp. SCN-SB TaxID=3373092 RepID=UPI003751C640